MNAALDSFGVVELRRYAMQPGKLQTLIDLFESEFVESQEACGMVPIGHYSDAADPNSFVWFRGFADMHSRRIALEAFYLNSQTWKANRNAANATLVDSDNVLLLRNARSHSGFDVTGLVRPSQSDAAAQTFVGAAIKMLPEAAGTGFIEEFENSVLPKIRDHAARIAYFVTEQSVNDFPALPVRSDEYAFVVAGVCASQSALETWTRAFDASGYEILQLRPAPRSLFR